MKRKPLTKEERDGNADRKEKYLDRRGIAFEDRRLLLPAATINWPPYPPRVVTDRNGAQSDFHLSFDSCWWCGAKRWEPGKQTTLELHHLAAGSRGRSHERQLFTMACSDCHREHVGRDDLGRWLYLKWKHDPEYTDWELLAIRFGHHLPDLITGGSYATCD